MKNSGRDIRLANDTSDGSENSSVVDVVWLSEPLIRKWETTQAKKKSLTSARIEPTTSRFDQPLLYQLSYEARWEQVVADYGGNCGNVNLKVTVNVMSLALRTQTMMDHRINSAQTCML